MKRTGLRRILLVGTAVGLTALAARGAAAQQPTLTRHWELRGPRFDFGPDGVWRRRVREVVRARELARSRGDFRALNAPAQAGVPLPSALAVTGVLNTPAVLLKFADTPTVPGDSTAYTNLLFGTTPPLGRPYTIRTFYEQMSLGVFSMRGAAVGWVTLDSNEAKYTGPATGCLPYGACNGVWSNAAFAALQAGLREAVAKADARGVDWSRFGFDPATGILDLVIFIQPSRDGACVTSGNNHIWSHRSSLGGVATQTDWPGHAPQKLRVADYTIQAGVGGSTSCDTTQIMGIGTAAHETGHGLNLPDLYDTDPNDGDDSEGIGEWGLMGSGNYARPFSPAFFEAWSRQFVGWVTVRPITTAGTYTLGPVETSDTVFMIRPTGSNPRGEYFLLENRQAINADSGTIGKGKAPGLLVWHVDSTQIASGGAVNSGPVHGVVLTEADGLNNLLSSLGGVSNRGDGGDPFPGSTGRTVLGPGPAFPRVDLNAGVGAGVRLDSIRQLSANGPMSFRVQLGGQVVVAATDTTARVLVHGTLQRRYQAFMQSGDTATIAMDTALQTNAAGTVRYRFASWSDGGARQHVVTAAGRDTTFTANLSRSFNVQVGTAGPGTVTATPAVPVGGAWLAEGDSVVLVAQPNPNAIFMGWSGDATIGQPRIVLRANQAYSVAANFAAAALDSVVAQLLNGHGLTPQQVLLLDQHGNGNSRFDIGDFVAWLDQSGTTVSAQLLARIFERAGR
jgi:M6 family metalloprotease-like protein